MLVAVECPIYLPNFPDGAAISPSSSVTGVPATYLSYDTLSVTLEVISSDKSAVVVVVYVPVPIPVSLSKLLPYVIEPVNKPSVS